MTIAKAAELAAFAGLLADRTRAGICLTLLDGRDWTAGDLARELRVAPSTASAHLNALVDGLLLTERRAGRNRHVRLAGPHAAGLIEQLLEYLPAAGQGSVQDAPRSLRECNSRLALTRARTCYDHLAGRLGVAITEAMCRRRFLDPEPTFGLTEAGWGWLAGLGVDVGSIRAGRRPVVRSCLDWTQRRPHLGGAAGAAVCARFLDQGWIVRIGTNRAVDVTRTGCEVLRDELGIDSVELLGRQPSPRVGAGGPPSRHMPL